MTISVGNLIVAGGATVDTSEVLSALNKQGLKVWVGTKTQRDALPESIKNDDKITFLTYDSEEDIYLIIDTIISYSKTWSSVKISTELAKKINSSDVYTKTEVMTLINSKVASALKYRGAVATVAALPSSGQENGDSYYVQADGYMYAWSSDYSDWQALGSATDMTNYYTKSEVDALLADMSVKFQYTTMPTADSTTVGKIIQYTGADTNDYKNGYWYKGVDNGDSTYSWSLYTDDKYALSVYSNDLQLTYSGASYPTTSDLITQLTLDIVARKHSSGTVGGNIAITWTGKSCITGSYSIHDSGAGFVVLDFENAQDGNKHCVYYISNGSATGITWSTLATKDNILDNNYDGGFMAGTVAWFKTGNLFNYPTAGSFWSSTFLLSDRDGAWTGILKLADNGSGSVIATLVSLGASPRGGNEFYYDDTSYCLYFCGTWDRLTITQLTGAKVDLSLTSTTQEEAKQNTKIVPIDVVTTDSTNQLKSINATDTTANPDILNLLPIGNYFFTWGAMKLCTDTMSPGDEEWQVSCYSSNTTISAIGDTSVRWQVAWQRSPTPLMYYRQYSYISKSGESYSYKWSDWQRVATKSDLGYAKFPTVVINNAQAIKITRNSVSSGSGKYIDVFGNVFTIGIGDQSNRFYVAKTLTMGQTDISAFARDTSAMYIYSNTYQLHFLELLGDLSYEVIAKSAIPAGAETVTIQ